VKFISRQNEQMTRIWVALGWAFDTPHPPASRVRQKVAKKKKKSGSKDKAPGGADSNWATAGDRQQAESIEAAFLAGNSAAVRRLAQNLPDDADPKLVALAADFLARTLPDKRLLAMGAGAICIVLVVGAIVLT
jgi:hypothetical protein